MSNAVLENTLKEMLLREDIKPGERLTEAALAERLGVSRTPIRNILPRLAAEGFLTPVGKQGYIAAEFSSDEIENALDLRSVLEGWAARLLAQRGVSKDVLAELEECLSLGDSLFVKRHLELEDEHQYGVINARFHDIIIKACNSALLSSLIARLNLVPFAAPSVIVFDQVGLRTAFDLLHRAHGFHHAIVDAIVNGDGARAEFLFREHANHQRESMLERRKAKKAEKPEKLKGGKARRTKRVSR